MLYGVEPAAGARLCIACHAQKGWLEAAEPSRFRAAWVDFVVDGVSFGQPAVWIWTIRGG